MLGTESSYQEILLVAVVRPTCHRAQLSHVSLVETQHRKILPTSSTILYKKGAAQRGTSGKTATWVKLVLKMRS